MTKKKIALIDGYGFVFRAYHSLPPLTRQDGTPVGAVYGFTNMILRLLAGLNMSHICMIFDSGSKTFRNDIYQDYKANRPPCPEDLIPQFPLIREASEAFNLYVAEKVGYEADDLIATLAKNAAKQDFEVVIVSSDKDLMQLVDDKITMFDAMKNKKVSSQEVAEKFLVPPKQVLDVLSLMGDASDNVPGVRGIGPKIAAELINKYGSLENLLNNLDEIKQNKRRQSLQEGIELAKLSKKLITLDENVPMDLDMDQFAVQDIEPEKLINFLQEQGFRSLQQRVAKEFGISNPKMSQNNTYNTSNSQNMYTNDTYSIDNISKLDIFCQDLNNIHSAIINLEFIPDQPNNVKTIIFSAISDQNNGYNIKTAQIKIINTNQNQANNQDLFNQKVGENNIEKQEESDGLELQQALKHLKNFLQDPAIIKIGYKIKEIYKFLAKNDVQLAPTQDIAVMSYIINSANNKSHIRNLIDLNLDENIEENDFGQAYDDLEKNKEPKLFHNPEQKEQFYFFTNLAIYRLYQLLQQRIFANKLNFVYQRFERPLLPVLAQMEMNGILIDKVKLKSLSNEFDLEIKKLTSQIHQLCGEEFNIASPKQLSHILFEKLNLPAGKKSKTGSYSTNSEILQDLNLSGHEVAGKILDWRQFSKLKSTYSDALQDNINDITGRIHTNFSNISTVTGRLSSSNPNLQNIPIRSPEGKKIRSAFIAKKNHKFILADYSQIELRVLAHISNINALKQAFKEDKDIHSITASQIFQIDANEVNSDMRRKAKAINFGIIYGISAFGLARQLKIERKDADNYIKAYLEKYPGISEFMEHYQNFAAQNGYVQTITGRKCFIKDINSKNPTLKGLAQRLAINAPIQGSAADIIKKAMIDLDQNLQNSNLQAKMLLQVHDELILEVPEDQIKATEKLLKETMENTLFLDLPLKVDIKISDNW